MEERGNPGVARDPAGPFIEVFGDVLRKQQGSPLGVNLREFSQRVEAYDYSTVRRMIRGNIPLQPRAMEVFAQALGIEPERFLEYRAHQVREAVKRHPELGELVYETVMAEAAILDSVSGASGDG